mmetsp:Transcript_16625/g.24876  ORF Transcript_16625/g.24876 Transcript_16625/m.24876 type:complete len:236 (-) Transcript_16625:343-1050(-)
MSSTVIMLSYSSSSESKSDVKSLRLFLILGFVFLLALSFISISNEVTFPSPCSISFAAMKKHDASYSFRLSVKSFLTICFLDGFIKSEPDVICLASCKKRVVAAFSHAFGSCSFDCSLIDISCICNGRIGDSCCGCIAIKTFALDEFRFDSSLAALSSSIFFRRGLLGFPVRAAFVGFGLAPLLPPAFNIFMSLALPLLRELLPIATDLLLAGCEFESSKDPLRVFDINSIRFAP